MFDVHCSVLRMTLEGAPFELFKHGDRRPNYPRTLFQEIDWHIACTKACRAVSVGQPPTKPMIRAVLLACIAAFRPAVSIPTPACMAEMHRDGRIEKHMKCDFTGTDLRGKDMSYAVFKGATFRGAILTNADVHESRFEEVDFGDANLDGINGWRVHVLGNVSWMNASVVGADFTEALFEGAVSLIGHVHSAVPLQFRGANLQDTTFTMAEISYLDFSAAALNGCVFTEARLRNVKLDFADLTRRDCRV